MVVGPRSSVKYLQKFVGPQVSVNMGRGVGVCVCVLNKTKARLTISASAKLLHAMIISSI